MSVHGGGRASLGACMVEGGMLGWGPCIAGRACLAGGVRGRGACVQERRHPTGMHSCFYCFQISLKHGGAARRS